MAKPYVGSPVNVLDSPRLLTGRGKYVADLSLSPDLRRIRYTRRR